MKLYKLCRNKCENNTNECGQSALLIVKMPIYKNGIAKFDKIIIKIVKSLCTLTRQVML